MFKLFDYERTCPYYPRFDDSPQNRGFVTESYTSGVDMLSFIFQSMEARYSIINKALSTSITGEQNRKSIKTTFNVGIYRSYFYCFFTKLRRVFQPHSSCSIIGYFSQYFRVCFGLLHR